MAGRDNVSEALFFALTGDGADSMDELRKELRAYRETYRHGWNAAMRNPLCNALLTAMQEACDYTDSKKHANDDAECGRVF